MKINAINTIQQNQKQRNSKTPNFKGAKEFEVVSDMFAVLAGHSQGAKALKKKPVEMLLAFSKKISETLYRESRYQLNIAQNNEYRFFTHRAGNNKRLFSSLIVSEEKDGSKAIEYFDKEVHKSVKLTVPKGRKPLLINQKTTSGQI